MKTVVMNMLYFGYELLESLYFECKDYFIMPKSHGRVYDCASVSI